MNRKPFDELFAEIVERESERERFMFRESLHRLGLIEQWREEFKQKPEAPHA